ncbi:hypothetical protein P3T76_000844 [Phytophthora citrophthora]|uniref:Uncharacterized protein n=1 Tax=Phytophthora citrophthora TaxID=4793 RepID=A0AAD9H1Z8_9STRA|nr:hypothetical protein P3T76_000844 [Phytophthora citrophthora]
MPKRKANWWPSSILSDPDVLSVDDEGRFVLCKICHVHYAVHGGKKPKPVIMNSNFRTRAWDVHKERTNSHRMQKKQERLQQAKTEQQQQRQQQPADSAETQQQQPQGQQMQPLQGQTQTQKQTQKQTQTQTQSRPMSALATQSQVLTQAPPHQVQGQDRTTASVSQQVPTQALWRQHQDTQLQQQQQQLELEETKDAAGGQVQVRNSAIEHQPTTAHPETVTTMAMSRHSSLHSGELVNAVGKRPAHAMSADTPTQRRHVFHAGSPGSSMQLLAESEAARRPNAHAYERHSMLAASGGIFARRTEMNDHPMATGQQADSSARWRHMHNDVSRALNVPPRRRQPSPSSYTSGELRAAKTLVQTETGDLGSNNSERVAKKLRSLNAEFHASNMRHADGYNVRHTDVFDRRSAGYKEYWGTLRDVYTSSGTSGGSINVAPYRKTHHRSTPLSRAIQKERKEAEADSTTPDDSGSSEEALPKPAVVVHDASLINAIERLTDATSKQVANLYQKEVSDTKKALTKLTSVMTDLRVQQGAAFGRMIELQEKHLKVMEGILEIKLRKEAARRTRDSCNSNESTGSSSSGSSPADSSNTDSSTPSPGTESSALSLHESN